MTMRKKISSKKYVLPAAVLALLVTALAWAAVAQVSDSAPTPPELVVKVEDDDADDSLRDVIANAGNGDVITFAPGVTTITLSREILFDKRNITIDGGGVVTITKDAEADFRLLYYQAGTGTLTLKGLIIENGNIDGLGGGVRILGDALLEDCVFRNNTARDGGGAYVSYTATITRCTFTGNTGGSAAGAVYAEDMILTNCTFTGNSTDNAGGAASATMATVTNCTFTGNTAGYGGAVYAHTTAVLNDCVFTGNTAIHDSGGAVYASGTADISNCAFTDNTARRDGGAVNAIGSVDLNGCTFTGNEASRGGAVLTWGDADVKNCSFTGNKPTGKNGAVYADGKRVLTDCTFGGGSGQDWLLIVAVAAAVLIGLTAAVLILQKKGKLAKKI